jgi:hypothetical protein
MLGANGATSIRISWVVTPRTRDEVTLEILQP